MFQCTYLIFAKDGRKSSERWDQEIGARDHSFAGLLAFFCFCGFQDVSGCKKCYMLAYSSASVKRCCFFPGEEKEGQFRHSSKTKIFATSGKQSALFYEQFDTFDMKTHMNNGKVVTEVASSLSTVYTCHIPCLSSSRSETFRLRWSTYEWTC